MESIYMSENPIHTDHHMGIAPLSILPIHALKDNYIWMIINPHSKQALVVDPGEAAPVQTYFKQHKLTLTAILITHHHWDHTNGIAKLRSQYDVPVFGPAKEKVMQLTNPLQEGEEILFDSHKLVFQILDIPGHTLGHIAYYSQGSLFCGDTLFAAGCGKLFEGTAKQMYASLQKIALLPDETKIYCAHEYTLNNLRFAETIEPENKIITDRIKQVSELRKKGLPSLPSTLREEKLTNPFLRCDSPELISNVEKYAGQRLTQAVEVFTWLRKRKDGFR